MTWSAFALFLARRTEFAFKMGHFLIILRFIAYWPLFKFLFLSSVHIWSFLKSLFWMKQIQGSVRIMNGPSLFSFYFLSFSISFPQINHFYYFTSLHGLQDVENHCSHSRDKSWRLVEKFHVSAFLVYYSPYIIGLESTEEITKP